MLKTPPSETALLYNNYELDDHQSSGHLNRYGSIKQRHPLQGELTCNVAHSPTPQEYTIRHIGH